MIADNPFDTTEKWRKLKGENSRTTVKDNTNNFENLSEHSLLLHFGTTHLVRTQNLLEK